MQFSCDSTKYGDPAYKRPPLSPVNILVF